MIFYNSVNNDKMLVSNILHSLDYIVLHDYNRLLIRDISKCSEYLQLHVHV